VTDGELVTTYTYDAAGRVTETIRPNGSKSVYEYNEKDEIVRLENRSNDDKVESSFKYEYDATGNIVKEEAKNDTDSAVRTYEYNEADELTGFTEKSADTDLEYKYEYNEAGDRTSLEIKGKIKDEDVSEIIKYEYEEGLLIKETSSRKGDIQYEYDGNGNLVKKTGADNDVSYEYTVENRLKAVKSGGELLMAAGYDGDGNRIFQVTRNSRDFEATNPLEEESSLEHIEAPNTGDNNWYLEAFLYGVWQGTANNLAAFNSSLAVKYTEDLRDEWDEIYHGRVYDKEAGEIDFSKEDLSLLKKAGLSDEEINTITSKDIEEDKLEDDITIPGATYDVSEKYYDLTRYVNDVNTENTEVLQEYTQSGSLKSSHIHGNERIYSDVYDPVTEAFNVSNYNYDGRGSVVQTVTGTDVTSQLSYNPFGNLTMGEPEGASYYGFNAEDTSALADLQYLRARYYDTNDGRFLTADDYLGNKYEPLTLNRYAYTANNPVRYNDPSGHFMGLMAYGMKKTMDFAVSATKKTLGNIASSTVKAATGLAATAVSFISPYMGKTIATAGKTMANKIKNSYYRGGNTYNNSYKTKNNYFAGTKSGGGTSVGKQKQNNTTQKIVKPLIETFVNMMGVGVQIAVGSSQIKKHLDQVKKKVVEFYCGVAEKYLSHNNENIYYRNLYNKNIWSKNSAEEDMLKGDMTKKELRDLPWINWTDFMQFEFDHEMNMRKLFAFTSIAGSKDMKNVINEMLYKFESGEGGTYSSRALTEIVKNHEVTQQYMSDFTDILRKSIEYNDGNISTVVNSEQFSKDINKKVKFTKYAYEGLDILSGLTIAIHAWTESRVDIAKYEKHGNHYSGTLKFTLIDNFGLDKEDLDNDKWNQKYGILSGFRSWYILQHYEKYKEKYNPFKVKVEIEYPFEGVL